MIRGNFKTRELPAANPPAIYKRLLATFESSTCTSPFWKHRRSHIATRSMATQGVSLENRSFFDFRCSWNSMCDEHAFERIMRRFVFLRVTRCFVVFDISAALGNLPSYNGRVSCRLFSRGFNGFVFCSTDGLPIPLCHVRSSSRKYSDCYTYILVVFNGRDIHLLKRCSFKLLNFNYNYSLSRSVIQAININA